MVWFLQVYFYEPGSIATMNHSCVALLYFYAKCSHAVRVIIINSLTLSIFFGIDLLSFKSFYFYWVYIL